MVTQCALNTRLSNPFVFFDLSKEDCNAPSEQLKRDLQRDFESGKIIVIEGFHPENLEYFLNMPSVEFPEWVPPVEDHKIMTTPVDDQHPFWSFYPDAQTILEFQKNMIPFQESWEQFHQKLFPEYDFSAMYWSWRMNKMDLGYLHLDIPPGYKEHQQRCFMNLSQRARVLEVGPTLESLISHFYHSEELEQYSHLNTTEYLTEIKKHLFKKLKLDEHHLPRHTLRLASGAIWISHSSLITHGIVYGEKTVCLETRIPPHQIKNSGNEFSKVMERVKSNDIPSPEPLNLYF